MNEAPGKRMMNLHVERTETKKFALLALAVFALAEIVFAILSICLQGQSLPTINLANAIMTIFVRWIPTLMVVHKIEKRGAESLGLVIERKQYLAYAIFAISCVIVPAFFVGFDRSLLIEFVEQIVYIGLLEEFFYRGFLMNRLCNWLGNSKGLFWSSFIFGLGHVISRVADHGFGIIDSALVTGGQAFLGGLIFGLIYLKVRNIWPSAILHVSTNMYLGRIIEMLN
jgi:membrane protease YdiL (CAAX protease family)